MSNSNPKVPAPVGVSVTVTFATPPRVAIGHGPSLRGGHGDAGHGRRDGDGLAAVWVGAVESRDGCLIHKGVTASSASKAHRCATGHRAQCRRGRSDGKRPRIARRTSRRGHNDIPRSGGPCIAALER